MLLARIDPAHFRFEVRTAPAGDKGLDQWMSELGAALVVNGSYFGRNGLPLGPSRYNATAGAFVASAAFTGLRDLAATDWKTALDGAQSATVYPMLIAADTTRVPRPSRWLASRGFVGQDSDSRVIIVPQPTPSFPLTGSPAFSVTLHFISPPP